MLFLIWPCFFAWHVFGPQGFSGHFDGIAALIAACACMAMFRYKAGVILVIAVSGMTGLLFIKSWLVQYGVFL
ncbi:MAG: hypothetical protein ITD42_03360 [Nitrosospira sp.]|nr:hypothetical protein [Nitrosospira sp.]